MAEADLNKQLGTLRYLRGLRSARQRLLTEAPQQPGTSDAGASGLVRVFALSFSLARKSCIIKLFTFAADKPP